MAFAAEVVADSVSPGGSRLTTIAVTMPRSLLAELNTHRTFARNSASSRAIPVQRIVDAVLSDPYVPVYWGKNQAGMQARKELSSASIEKATLEWLAARDSAVQHARRLLEIGTHKQDANRLLEPWMWTTVLVTATDWQNFFQQRCHPDAHPSFQRFACMMRDARDASTPRLVRVGEWHLPYVSEEDWLLVDPASRMRLAYVSAARCARVSYLRHGERRDHAEDVVRTEQLRASGHWSPLEHPAAALEDPAERCGPFRGWKQLRKFFPGESGEPADVS